MFFKTVIKFFTTLSLIINFWAITAQEITFEMMFYWQLRDEIITGFIFIPKDKNQGLSSTTL